MLFTDQSNVNAITTTKKDNLSQIIIIIAVSPRAQVMMMNLECGEHADHTFSKKSLFFF